MGGGVFTGPRIGRAGTTEGHGESVHRESVHPGMNTSMAKTADHGASLEGGKEAGSL